MRIKLICLIAIFSSLISSVSSAQAVACSAAKRSEILAPVSTESPSVTLNCNLTLKPTERVTKLIQIIGSASSGVVLDCAGGTLGAAGNTGDIVLVRSQKLSTTTPTWDRPENITIKNCEVYGGIRVYGLGKTGEGADVKASSLSLGHTARAQSAAPKNIILDNLNFYANQRTPVYFAPGVTYSTISNSDFHGIGASVAIYLDAESGFNQIYRNRFLDFVSPREIIAVDGSANNLIHRNIFNDVSSGGIYLYRNSGEGGTIRHQTPDKNLIINNVFFAQPSIPGAGPNFSSPSVWVASRNGGKNYCGADAGYPFGSSINDNDLAKDNVIAQNLAFNYLYSSAYIFSYSPNYLISNTTSVAPAPPSDIARESGCYKADGAPNPFIQDGQTWSEVFVNGVAQSNGYLYHCNNAVVTPERIIPPPTINSFVASKSKITIGETVTLSWDALEATSLQLDPGAINVLSTANRSIILKPLVTTTYRLTASNIKGTATKSVSVIVDPIGSCVYQDTNIGAAMFDNMTLSTCQTTCHNYYNSAADSAYIWDCRFIYPDNHETVITLARDPIVAPTAPRSVSASAGVASAAVKFVAPSSNGGAPILEYLVYVYKSGSSTAVSIVRNGTATTVSVPGLTTGQGYTFRVRARNRVGYSSYSAATTVIVAK